MLPPMSEAQRGCFHAEADRQCAVNVLKKQRTTSLNFLFWDRSRNVRVTQYEGESRARPCNRKSGRVSRVSENAKIVRKVGIGGRRAEVTDYLTSYDAGPSPGL